MIYITKLLQQALIEYRIKFKNATIYADFFSMFPENSIDDMKS